MMEHWNKIIQPKGIHKTPLSKNTNDDVDVCKNSGSSRDDALLLASFADIASKTLPIPGAEPSSSSPVLSSNISPCRFPSSPSILPSNSTYCEQYLQASRPRAISYSSNEVKKLTTFIPLMPAQHSNPQVQLSLPKPEVIISHQPKSVCRKILRRKFSWKHYPPLEDFLIANREEYLRHSTLNYTLQQKKYNNMLTEQMIQLASQHRLVFDKNEFSFVTVRDRIRCYYKSYVQSLKKKGIVCGYAARKAGLISKEEMNKNAAKKAKIFVPN